MQHAFKKIALACVLATSGVAQAWTSGSEGTATFSGNITGAIPIKWEVTSGVYGLGDIDVNAFTPEAGGGYRYSKQVSGVNRLFNIRMKEMGKMTQLYDGITIRYLDEAGKPLTMQQGASNPLDFTLSLKATSATQPSTQLTLALPLVGDSLVRLVSGSNYANLGIASFAGKDAMLDGMTCPTTVTCWVGNTHGAKDTDIQSYVDTKLPKVTTDVTPINPADRYAQLEFDNIGPKAKGDNNVSFNLSAFKVKDTNLVASASILIDDSKPLVMTTPNNTDLTGDWKAAFTVEVSAI